MEKSIRRTLPLFLQRVAGSVKQFVGGFQRQVVSAGSLCALTVRTEKAGLIDIVKIANIK